MFTAAGACAAPLPVPTIDGRWTTFDETGRIPKAIVTIIGDDEHWSGHVVEVFREPGEPADPRCDACTGADRGARMQGLTILHLERTPGTPRLHGRILDPEEGITYRCIVTLEPNGDRLTIHAYIGTPLLGRDVVWRRMLRPAP